MSKIIVAVIGCGTIANSAHIPSYMKIRELAEVKYFCDLIPERAKAAVERYGSGIAVSSAKSRQPVRIRKRWRCRRSSMRPAAF